MTDNLLAVKLFPHILHRWQHSTWVIYFDIIELKLHFTPFFLYVLHQTFSHRCQRRAATKPGMPRYTLNIMSKCQDGKGTCSPTSQCWTDLLAVQVKQRASRCINPSKRGCLSFSPYLAPVWKVKNVLSQAGCHHRGSGSCVGRSAWGILSVVGPMAGLFTGANGMIYAQRQTHAFSHQSSLSRLKLNKSGCCKVEMQKKKSSCRFQILVWDWKREQWSPSCSSCRTFALWTMIQPSGPDWTIRLPYPALSPFPYKTRSSVVKAPCRSTVWRNQESCRDSSDTFDLCFAQHNKASQLGWDHIEGPPAAPCSSSVTSQTPLVTPWDSKLPVLKA